MSSWSASASTSLGSTMNGEMRSASDWEVPSCDDKAGQIQTPIQLLRVGAIGFLYLQLFAAACHTIVSCRQLKLSTALAS